MRKAYKYKTKTYNNIKKIISTSFFFPILTL